MSANPNSTERPFSVVLSSIFANLQDIVRSEVKLAKAEAREEIAGYTKGAAWTVTAILSAFFAVAFLLGAGFFALSYIVPQWAAALIMALGLGIGTMVCLGVRTSVARTLDSHITELSDTQSRESIA
ncbi:MAG: phage holin family protein [Steroidobacteraceae bacterium]